MEYALKFLTGLLVLLGTSAAAAWGAWKLLKRSEDPLSLVVKWIITVVAFFLLLASLAAGPFAPIFAAVIGIVIGVMWAPNLGALLASPLTALFDGGEREPEPSPFYSIARAKQKRGHYQKAIQEIRNQLERFPEDYEGWMFLAEIHGDNLKDNAAAQHCIEELFKHQDHTPKNLAFALNRSADWHLGLGSDRTAARQALERIIQLFPASEFAHSAAQRIAHLTSDQMLSEQKERPRIPLKHHESYETFVHHLSDTELKAEAPEERTARLVEHLNQHPMDVEAREELAKLYADHYHRMDLAADQIEQLVHAPGVPPKTVAHCLHLVADLHIRISGDKAAAVAALQRIIELFPNSAAASNAEKRIAYIEIELRRHEKSQVMKLGSYEENIGLKGQVPKPNPGRD